MSTERVALVSVSLEYGRWEARLSWPEDVVGLSACTWSSNNPQSYGMTVYAPAAEHFRQVAEELLKAADEIDGLELYA